jgi:TolA-binding protein
MIDRKSTLVLIFLFLNYCLQLEAKVLFAQVDLAQLKETYFTENRYSEFVDYLKNLKKEASYPEASYYIALSRYKQLRYLEETQNWEEYFNLGEAYRQELISQAREVIGSTSSKGGCLFVYANCLLWQYHKDMQDEYQESALADLLNAIRQYSDSADADLSVTKYVADRLSAYGDRINSQRVYSIYLDKLLASLEENQEERLISLAEELAYRENAMVDPFFAEEVFKKIDEINPDLVLDESTQYLRAYNLEKIKQYKDAFRQYRILTDSYLQSPHYAEAIFKMGVISAYIMRDIPSAQACFAQLLKESPVKQQALAGFYQLGLIAQYQGEFDKSREYYNALLEKSIETLCGGDLVNAAELRLKEIDENRALEFNLRTFMDASLKKDNEGGFLSPNVDIKVQHFKLNPNHDVRISSYALTAESGCMPLNLEYLWSGELGSAQPRNYQDDFATHYTCPGTKLIQLVVVTPSGILDRSLVFLDVE